MNAHDSKKGQSAGRGASRQPLNVLLLADPKPTQANTILDHVDALVHRTGHHVYCLNCRNWPVADTIDFDIFDVVIIHYSIAIIYDQYLPTIFVERIRGFRGLKAMFIQDEYREVRAYTNAMIDLGIHMLFTCVPGPAVGPIYGPLLERHVTVLPTLTGYVPDDDVEAFAKPAETRPFDIIYRGRPLPFELGDLAQEKSQIAIRVGELAKQYGLAVDLDWREEARIYGDRWLGLMASGRATLGTESGASVVDLDGSIAAAVEAYRAANPQAGYHEVRDAIFAGYEGEIVINTISPRAFEAIRLRTALILFPGTYSGVLQPWRHYIPLAKDYSNFAEVVRRLKDVAFLKELTDTAYDDIVGAKRYSYDVFARDVGERLTLEHQARGFMRPDVGRGGDVAAWRTDLDRQIERIIGRSEQPIQPAALSAAAIPAECARPAMLRRFLRASVNGIRRRFVER